ncbi:MAG: aspartate ammonia-lyase [Bacteroidetes bacterium]|nr:aspartate ammonia-lyase [Bacteroidota bacterium]MCL5035396.1 aspartate ammonia-lyase [Bacteroidota bacterium]
MEYRIEKDSLGELKVPASAYYGVQTQRAVENFPISGLKPHPDWVKATVLVKKAAAIVNNKLKLLDRKKMDAIVQACDEVLGGKHADEFVVDVFQAGAGTSHNMNANEMLANRAIEILGGKRGDYSIISPNDDVNMAQSTNDLIPAVIRVSAILLVDKFLPVLDKLGKSFEKKAKEFDHVIKSGRTHLQDATPIRLGQEFSGYAACVRGHVERIKGVREGLTYLGIGGTAVGTGVNADPKYRSMMPKELTNLTGIEFKQAKNYFEAMQSMAGAVSLSGALRNLALDITRIANDLRLLSSGPRTGLAEIKLPAVQPGSSIMPGKVNPSILEMVNMVSFQVIGLDTTVAYATQAGQMELNVMMPVIGFNLTFALEIYRNALQVMREKCVDGIEADEAVCRDFAEKSVSIVTALTPHIGYLKAAEVVKEAVAKNKTIRAVLMEKKLVDEKLLNEILDPYKLTEAGRH